MKDIVSFYRGEMINRALDNVEKSKDMPKDQQFTWVFLGWVMQKIVTPSPDQSPEMRSKLDATIK